ncbi:hypothetical protein WJX72_003438 [[Myrmecia] bisecta]|uniref:Uncharacterized protein n=1 Tax=[Myrmecia] bisecta TaxID=41462 RepID=A0AAW1R5L7_9CHLO
MSTQDPSAENSGNTTEASGLKATEPAEAPDRAEFWQYPRVPDPGWGMPDPYYHSDDLPVISLASKGQAGWDVMHVEEYSEEGLPQEHAQGEEPVQGQDRVVWGLDFTNGATPNIEANTLLSDEAKDMIYAYHKDQKMPSEQLAEMFRVRQQRILAIIALKELEEQARAGGEALADDLQEGMEGEGGFCPADEVVGTGERHYKLVYNADGNVDEAASNRAAAREEAELVAEFADRLQYNLGKVGGGIVRHSRKAKAPVRPEEGWSLVVRPLEGGAKPYVAQADGGRRELTHDEQLYLERMKPKPRRKIAVIGGAPYRP